MKYHCTFRVLLTLITVSSFFSGMAQRIIPEQEIIDLALKNSGAYQSSDLQLQQNRYLQKTGFNIPNPEVLAESPTGEFYTVGVLQSLEFPSVYIKQHQLRKQMTRLSEKQKEITRQDVNSMIRSLYLNLQMAEALYTQLQLQDSLYGEISTSAERQFNAGTIDHLAKTFTQAEAGEIHNQMMEIQAEYEAMFNQLKSYTGITDTFKTTPLRRFDYKPDHAGFDSSMILSNPSIQYYQQLRDVNKKSLSVEKNKALPGLVFGYLNQSAKETETYYRFRVGVTVPVWFWQYSGNIKAAKSAVQVAEQDSKAQQQMLTTDMHRALGDMKKFSQSLDYYEAQALRRADDIINTARRFFESGQHDHIGYLRNIHEAYLIKAKYLEALRNYNQSVITINYLTGKL